MKRTLPLICSLLIGLSTATFAESTISNKQIMSQNNYKSALALFQSKQFSDAFQAFDDLAKIYPENELVNFYYARSAYELKNYEAAFTIYDTILINNPNNHRARLEFARTLYMMNSLDQAKSEFEKVLASPIPPVVRKNVEKFLQAINDNSKDYYLSKIAIFGFGYDTNIGTNSGDSITEGLIPLNNNQEKSGIHFKTILVGNLVVPFKDNKKFAWETTGIGYIQEQYQEHANDIWLLSLASGISYNVKDYKNLTSVLYDRISVGSDSNMYYYGLSNSQTFSHGKNTLGLDLKYKKKKMFSQVDQSAGKNTTTKEAVLKYKMPFKDKKLTLDLMMSYAKEKQDYGTARSDTDKNTRKYKLALKKEFNSIYSGTVSYQKQYTDYKNLFTDGAQQVKRDDDIDNLTFKIDRKIDKTSSISFEISAIKADSTFDSVYSYDKKSMNVNYMVTF